MSRPPSDRWAMWRGLRSQAPRGWQRCHRRDDGREVRATFIGGRFAIGSQEIRDSGWLVVTQSGSRMLLIPESFALNYAIVGPA